MLVLTRNGEIYAPDIREVIARGRRLVIDGACKVGEIPREEHSQRDTDWRKVDRASPHRWADLTRCR